MGLFAFRRKHEVEAAANAVASSSVEAPKSKKQTVKPDGNLNRRNGGRRKRQQLPDAE